MEVTLASAFFGSAALRAFAGALGLASITSSPFAVATFGAAGFFAVAAVLGVLAFSAMGELLVWIVAAARAAHFQNTKWRCQSKMESGLQNLLEQ
jgi:hypothetical protein